MKKHFQMDRYEVLESMSFGSAGRATRAKRYDSKLGKHSEIATSKERE